MIDIILATRGRLRDHTSLVFNSFGSVFALFNRSRKVAIFVGSLVLVDLVFAGIHVAKCPAVEYFEACVFLKRQSELANTQT